MSQIAFVLEPRGPYSLEASASFVQGFAPCASSMTRYAGGLRLSFCADRTFEPVSVELREEDGCVHGRATGGAKSEPQAIAAQVARVLSLDGDGSGYVAIGDRDPVIGELLAALSNLRPVCFPSPYEAAAWGVLSARTTMQQAAKIKARLSSETGAFVAPARLLELDHIAGIGAEKLERLRGIARVALDGTLDAERLRSLPRDQALSELRALRGVGPWTATHIYLRGAAVVDEPAFIEPRVRRGFALAYGLGREPTEAELERASERWRPFRTWVCVALSALFWRRQNHGPEQRSRVAQVVQL